MIFIEFGDSWQSKPCCSTPPEVLDANVATLRELHTCFASEWQVQGVHKGRLEVDLMEREGPCSCKLGFEFVVWSQSRQGLYQYCLLPLPC